MFPWSFPYQVKIQSSKQVFSTLRSGTGYLGSWTLAPVMLGHLWPGVSGKCPGTSEVGTALSSIALEPYMLVCGFTHQLFVNDAFVY